jgi:hypothetical protein
MNPNSTAQNSINPRFAGAIFFAVFALLFLLFTKYTLLSFRDSAQIPLLPALFFSLLVGLFFGGIFAPFLVKRSRWLRPFFLGLLMACLALILLSLLILAHYFLTAAVLLERFQHSQDYLVFLGAILATLFLTIGLWLLPITGLVALYFNKRFWPRLLSVDQKRHINKTNLPHE